MLHSLSLDNINLADSFDYYDPKTSNRVSFMGWYIKFKQRKTL